MSVELCRAGGGRVFGWFKLSGEVELRLFLHWGKFIITKRISLE